MDRVAAIVLAAGRSSRMGAFKPLLEVAGRPLLAWALRGLREAGVDDVVVVAGHRRDDVAAVASAAGAEVLTSPDVDAGMYASLRAGLAGLDPAVTRFFVLPGDVPLVRPETLGRLLRQGLAVGSGGAEVTLPAVAGETGHPPLVAAALAREIRDADPPGGLRDVLAAHAATTTVVPVEDPGVLLDADTPEDLARLRELAPRESLPDAGRCLRLLAERGVPRERIDHSLVVAGVAAALAAALDARGQRLVAPLVTAAALLHDIARDRPQHAQAGAEELERLGYPRVAAVVRLHVRLGERAADEPDEAQAVYLADKLVHGSRVVGLDARFAVRLERFAGDEAALAGVRSRKEEARLVQRRVEQVLGRPVDDVLPAAHA